MKVTKESVLSKISDYLRDEYYVENFDTSKSLIQDYGINSLDVLKLIISIEEEFALMIPDEELSKFSIATINEIVEFICMFE